MVGHSGFCLHPFENLVPGVRYDAETDRLDLRMSWGAAAQILIPSVLLIIFAIVGVVLAVRGEPVAVLLAVGALAGCDVLVRVTRLRVTANTSGVEIHGLVRKRMIEWTEISGVGLQTTRSSRARKLLGGPPRSASDLFLGSGLGKDAPVIELRNGTHVSLATIGSLSRADGFTGDEPSPAEIKAGLLARYHAAVSGASPTYVPERGLRPRGTDTPE